MGCEKKHAFVHMKHQDWLIDLHSMKASETGKFHGPNPPAAKFSGMGDVTWDPSKLVEEKALTVGQAEVGMGFFVGLLGSLTTWDVMLTGRC